GAQIQRHREDDARSQHPETKDYDVGNDRQEICWRWRRARLTRGRPQSRKQQQEGEPGSQVESENDPVVAAAREGPDTELHDGSAHGWPKARGPTETARAGYDVGFFNHLAERTQVTDRIRHGS